jgi:putative nucleotidyltransferase with HDIG domain
MLATILLFAAHSTRARLGRWVFRCTLMLFALLALAGHLIEGPHWIGAGIFYAVTFSLIVELLFSEPHRWRSWFAAGLAGLSVVVLLSWLFRTLLPQDVALRIALSVLSIGLTGALSLSAHSSLQPFGFVRIAWFILSSAFMDVIVFGFFGQGDAISIPSRLLVVTFGVLLAAWYLDRSNLSHTMSSSQRLAYESLLGTVETLAQPDIRLTQEKLISTLVTTTEAVVAGSNEGWGRLLASAVMLVPGAEGGSIRLRIGEEFKFVAQQGFNDQLIGLGVGVHESSAWHGDLLAWHRGEPRILSRPFTQRFPLDADPSFQGAETHRIRANLHLPVLVDDRVSADINLDSFSAPNAFSDESLRTARQFALQVAALVKAGRERDKLESRLREFEFLELVTGALHGAHTGPQIAQSVVGETVRLMDSKHAALLLANEEGTNLRLSSGLGHFAPIVGTDTPWGHGLSWSAIHARETIHSVDAKSDPRGIDPRADHNELPYGQLTVPLLDSSGGTLGALLVARDHPQLFSPLDQRLVEVIAKVASGALERVRVARDLQRQVQESQNLLSLSQLLEGNDPESLEAALERVRQLADADAGVLAVTTNGVLRTAVQTGRLTSALKASLSAGLPPTSTPGQARAYEVSADASGETQTFLEALGVRTVFTVMIDVSTAMLLYRYERSGWSAAERQTLIAAGRMLGALLGRLERLRTLESAYAGALKTIGLALEIRDLETANHTERVAELSEAVARRLGLPESELLAIRWGAYLHDIGKFGLPDAILRKPSKLTPEEMEVARRHPMLGYELIRDLPFLPRSARQIVRSHHERWDGKGYPDGLHAEEIPLSARIFAVCDVFDALRSKRVYKEAFDLERSLEELQREVRGGHLEGRLVRALEEVVRRQEAIRAGT